MSRPTAMSSAAVGASPRSSPAAVTVPAIGLPFPFGSSSLRPPSLPSIVCHSGNGRTCTRAKHRVCECLSEGVRVRAPVCEVTYRRHSTVLASCPCDDTVRCGFPSGRPSLGTEPIVQRRLGFAREDNLGVDAYRALPALFLTRAHLFFGAGGAGGRARDARARAGPTRRSHDWGSVHPSRSRQCVEGVPRGKALLTRPGLLGDQSLQGAVCGGDSTLHPVPLGVSGRVRSKLLDAWFSRWPGGGAHRLGYTAIHRTAQHRHDLHKPPRVRHRRLRFGRFTVPPKSIERP